ncbi:hypothetical protein JXM83_06045 [Candidatus Woesearchaeota archaeon]|nr:hypothetical protein [Candidatus Woesearchaeota archaeon]
MKKAQFGFLVGIILFLVATLVLLGFSTGMFDFMISTADDSTCRASAIASSLANTATAGSNPIDLNCPINYIKVQEKKGKSDDDLIVYNVDQPFTSGEAKKLVKWKFFQDDSGNSLNEKEILGFNTDSNLKWQVYKYRLNQLVAGEMKSCWSELGEGKLDLFSSWFQYIGTEEGKGWINSWVPHRLQPPTVCVICSKIDFDHELYLDMSSNNVMSSSSLTPYKDDPNSLIYWLTHIPVSNTAMSYYEYLQDDYSSDIFGIESRNYDYKDGSFAVVFTRTKVHGFDQIGSLISNKLGIPTSEVEEYKDGVSSLVVIPYTQDALSDYCDVLAN